MRSLAGLLKNSAGAASWAMRPWSKNITRSDTSRAKPISWVTTIMVMPPRASSRITSSTSCTISGSRAEVGSSNSITLGCMASARAIATRCCWPPDSCHGYLCAWSCMPTRRSRAMACSLAWARGVWRMRRGASVTLSSTLMWPNRLNCWNTMPTSLRCFCSVCCSSVTGSPPMVMVPLSCGSSRLMARSSVLLPEPEAPMITVTSPVLNTVETSRSTWWLPKDLQTRFTTMKGVGWLIGCALPRRSGTPRRSRSG